MEGIDPENFETISFCPFGYDVPFNNSNDPDVNFFLGDNHNTEFFNEQSLCNYLEKKSSSEFSLLNLNIRSLSKNIDSLKSYLHSLKFSFKIICLTETWSVKNETEKNSNLQLPNYTVIHQPRDTGHAGGGVCMFIHNSLIFKVRNDLSINDVNCEA